MMIRKVVKAAGIGLILFSLVGCIQVDTLIKVKSDGSGTIEETVLMSKEMVQMMEGMMKQLAEGMKEAGKEASEKPPEQEQTMEPFSLFDEAKLKEKVGDMGEGVTYVSGKKVSTDTFEGYEAVFAFSDINKLKLNQNPSDNVPSDASQGGSEEPEEYVTFCFKKGKPATLRVKMPENEPDEKDDAAKPDETGELAAEEQQQAAMMLAQMKSMFKGMKIAMAIEVEGSVVETNATHVDGSRVTIMELDFGRLLEMPEKLVQFSQLQPESVEDAKAFMKDIPGFKVDMNKELTIKFE